MRMIGKFGVSRALRRLRRPLNTTIGIAVCAIAGCVYDANDRCSEHQVVTPDNASCVCASGYSMVEGVCVACGVNEVSGQSGCVCAPGFGRSSASAPCAACGPNAITNASGACECSSGYVATATGCEAIATGLGAACAEGSKPCTDATYSTCHSAPPAEGYCTKTGCTVATDCSDGYACDTSAAPAYCRRPPSGAGAPCTSSADCASGEATYCDTYASHSCLVQGCSLAPDNCFPGTECCDLSAFGVPQPLCVPQGGCAK
jgi:hypothetical protein